MDLKIIISNLIINNCNQGTWKNSDGRIIADEVDVFNLAEKIIGIINNEAIEFAKWLEDLTEEFYFKNKDLTYKELYEIFKTERSETVV